MSNIPEPGQLYRHFKGDLYRIVTLARHSETGENMVVYQALYGDYEVYTRPLSMFMEKLDKAEYPNTVQEHRFELQEDLINMPAVPGPSGENTENVKESGTVEAAAAQTQEEQEELNIDPLVLEFLDAGTYEERLNILSALHHRITDDMINTMAIAVDLEIEEGDTEERFEELRSCLLTFEKYECNRLR